MTTPSNKDGPTLIISGGGPSGLLAAILYAQIGISSTVLERASEPDQWSTKSFTIVLKERGTTALKRAGEKCFDAAKEKGIVRSFIHIMDATTGELKSIPNKIPGLGFSRPVLVDCLEEVASKLPNVTIKRGVGISKVVKSNENDGESSFSNSELQVVLEDGTTLSASHIIGADGKWSNVRRSFPDLEAQATIRSEPTFGVHVIVPFVPEGWKLNGTYVIKPVHSDEAKFYIIAAPLPSNEEISVSIVCYDETIETYPWLAPQDNLNTDTYTYGSGGWEDEYSAMPKNTTDSSSPSDSESPSLAENLATLLQKEVPAFYDAIGRESLNSARINRRTSWVQMKGKDDNSSVTYSTSDGLVTLIGDAAHAVIPSMGEGCNTAMESAAKLADIIVDEMKEKETETCTKEMLSAAFLKYGSSRPKEMIPIQEMSASAGRWKAKG